MTAKQFTINATNRTTLGKKVKNLRQKGQLPAVVYGHGLDNTALAIDEREFGKVYSEAGTSSLVDLVIDNQKPIKVLLHEPQRHYLHQKPIHADFYAVKMTEKIETAIPIHYVGVAPAVDELEGNFITNKDELQIRCFPADLIPAVEVDISVLKTFDDQLRISDLKLPETIEVMDDPEETIALVTPPRSEEEIAEELAADTTEAEAAAVEELGKTEEGDTEGSEAAQEASDGQ